jgi:hypothetical protein
MYFLLLYITTFKLFTSGACAVFSYLSSHRKTAPVTVWRLFGAAFSLWFLQILFGLQNFNQQLIAYNLHPLTNIINDGLGTTVKLLFFLGACVVMHRNYIKRET